ncbi:HNH endonuclease [Leptotrichia massiliensis]|uniref:HNH endonuclease n=1 Tax=Leptotrichia massiliensis TaxID=1852388 RepID=UPI0028D0212C|nr:HNH endonuclease [Leptotrichia massiliensis]
MPFKIGQIIKNQELTKKFEVGNSGGMRYSKKNNILVIICDHTKNLYDDKWKGDILHYTGMGKKGDQDLEYRYNKKLVESNSNGVDINIHLFEVLEKNAYVYRGIVKLDGIPYQEEQKDENDSVRKVWMFPLKLVSSTPNETIEYIESIQKKKVKKLSQFELQIKAKEASNRETCYQMITSKYYVRDQSIARYAKKLAKGKCQLCDNPAPSEDKEGEPYLESHHINWLSEGGKDEIDNTVALCPNCHRKMHIVNCPEDKEKLLFEVKKRNNK